MLATRLSEGILLNLNIVPFELQENAAPFPLDQFFFGLWHSHILLPHVSNAPTKRLTTPHFKRWVKLHLLFTEHGHWAWKLKC